MTVASVKFYGDHEASVTISPGATRVDRAMLFSLFAGRILVSLGRGPRALRLADRLDALDGVDEADSAVRLVDDRGRSHHGFEPRLVTDRDDTIVALQVHTWGYPPWSARADRDAASAVDLLFRALVRDEPDERGLLEMIGAGAAFLWSSGSLTIHDQTTVGLVNAVTALHRREVKQPLWGYPQA